MNPEIILVVSFLSLVAGSVDTDRSGAETGMELDSYPRNGFMCKLLFFCSFLFVTQLSKLIIPILYT